MLDKYNHNSEEEIDLSIWINFLKRNVRLISSVSVFGVVFTGIVGITSTKEWKGEFQIVLSDAIPSNAVKNQLKAFADIGSQENQLETEVEILKSPSVLMNVFEFAKTNNNSLSKLRFNTWRKQLNINLKKNTSVLTLSYVDTNKDLILPVLKEISDTYQVYSGKRRRRRIDLGMEFFNNQIKLYNKKSIQSFKQAQDFAYKQDLSSTQSAEGIDNYIQNNVNIEEARIKAVTEIRTIEQQLKQIDLLEDSSEEIINIASVLKGFSEEEVPKLIKNLDSRLTKLILVYKENDQIIKSIKQERRAMITLLKKQIKGFLTAQKEEAQARLKASTRPDGVLIKYRQLLSKANKDRLTLNKLENQYRELALEKARIKDPWELITKPTLFSKPISPQMEKLIGLGIFSGFILGCGVSSFYEKRLDVIHSINEIKLIVNTKIIQGLPSNKKESWEELIKILAFGQFAKISGPIAILPGNQIDSSEAEKIQKHLNQSETNMEGVIIRNSFETINFENIILVSRLGTTKRQEINELNNKLLIQNKQFLGVFVLT